MIKRPQTPPGYRDEIAEAIAKSGPRSPGAHDFDGLEAVGQWIVAERTSLSARTQIPVWTVMSVGPNVAAAIGRKLEVGDRLLFQDPDASFVHDHRGFVLIHCHKIVAVLRPATLPPPIQIAEDVQ